MSRSFQAALIAKMFTNRQRRVAERRETDAAVAMDRPRVGRDGALELQGHLGGRRRWSSTLAHLMTASG